MASCNGGGHIPYRAVISGAMSRELDVASFATPPRLACTNTVGPYITGEGGSVGCVAHIGAQLVHAGVALNDRDVPVAIPQIAHSVVVSWMCPEDH